MGVSIMGWAHLPFGRLYGLALEDLITRVGGEALQHTGPDGAALTSVFNRSGSALAHCVSVLESTR
jgi:acetyl-CoA C-acetyltransferase